jgi:hypothetical protein
MIPGRYAVALPDAADTLVLRGDGRYVHHFWMEETGVRVDSGTWTLASRSGEPVVEFTNYDHLWRLAARHPGMTPRGPGFFEAPVELSSKGEVRLILTVEPRRWYTRVGGIEGHPGTSPRP